MLFEHEISVTEQDVTSAILSGDFERALSIWRDTALAKEYAIGNDILAWDMHGQTLEARLIYLSMVSNDEQIKAALEKFRMWMLDQKSSVTTWPELGEAPFALPKSMYVGQSEIDRDHEVLFEYANRVRDALRRGDAKRAEEVAEDLIAEILDHFDREEVILKRTGYPEADCHARYHDRLRGKAADLREIMHTLSGGGPESLITYDALLKFLVNDPISADMDFKAFFSEKEA